MQNGIVNAYSGELGYVNDVTIENIPSGKGLWLNNNAGNSGPYTKLTIVNVAICIQVDDLSGTRGVHGLNCTLAPSSSGPGLLVNSYNNSLEDIYISGTGATQDGIQISGATSQSFSNLLFNITGVGLKNVIHLASTATDVSILGVTNSQSTNTIQDDTAPMPLTAAHVGMYVLGEQLSGGIGYSRITTSAGATAPTWLVGTNTPLSPCAPGSLYSRTQGTLEIGRAHV